MPNCPKCDKPVYFGEWRAAVGKSNNRVKGSQRIKLHEMLEQRSFVVLSFEYYTPRPFGIAITYALNDQLFQVTLFVT